MLFAWESAPANHLRSWLFLRVFLLLTCCLFQESSLCLIDVAHSKKGKTPRGLVGLISFFSFLAFFVVVVVVIFRYISQYIYSCFVVCLCVCVLGSTGLESSVSSSENKATGTCLHENVKQNKIKWAYSKRVKERTIASCVDNSQHAGRAEQRGGQLIVPFEPSEFLVLLLIYLSLFLIFWPRALYIFFWYNGRSFIRLRKDWNFKLHSYE